MYKLTFVPVIEPGEKVVRENTAAGVVDSRLWQLRHKLRSYKNCWCDNDSMASVALGVVPEFFVVEVEVRGAEAGMIYLAEDGICYMRKSARNEKYTVVEVRDLQEERKQQLLLNEGPVTVENNSHISHPSKNKQIEIGVAKDVMKINHEEQENGVSMQNLHEVEWMKEGAEFQKRKKKYYEKIKSNLQKEIDLQKIDIIL